MTIANGCLFSNEPTDTVEHVIPRWLQRKFSLQELTYSLPNGTQLKYKNAVVPATSRDNSKFGEIEDKISNGTASDEEIYLWAFKIHVGLIYISSNLKFNIRNPNSPKFWDVNDFGRDVWLFQQLYKVWQNGGKTTPSPFGTVLKFKSLGPETDFDLAHNIESRTLFINIGSQVIFVSFFDKGFIRRSGFIKGVDYHRKEIAKVNRDVVEDFNYLCFVKQRIWVCEASYLSLRLQKKFTIIATDNYLVSPLSSLQKPRSENKEELEIFCRSFGLNLVEYNKNSANTYANITTDEYSSLKPVDYDTFKAILVDKGVLPE